MGQQSNPGRRGSASRTIENEQECSEKGVDEEGCSRGSRGAHRAQLSLLKLHTRRRRGEEAEVESLVGISDALESLERQLAALQVCGLTNHSVVAFCRGWWIFYGNSWLIL